MIVVEVALLRGGHTDVTGGLYGAAGAASNVKQRRCKAHIAGATDDAAGTLQVD